ncbi:MAG: chitin disaccharide deacetylase [Clostridium sp.]
MKVIVNGDDFGYSIGQNLGILECFKNGIMTSTSLMVNMPGFNHAIELMKENKELNVGLHFVMTVGNPVASGAKEIVNNEGVFDRDLEKIGNADIEEIRREYKAQLDKFLSTGFKPTHLDFHYGITEKQYRVIMELAKSINVPVRAMNKEDEKLLEENNLKYSKNFISDFYNEGVTIENLISIFESNKDKDLIEIMSHPAYVDSVILNNSSYTTKRAIEMEILTSVEIKEYIKNNSNIELISYKEL